MATFKVNRLINADGIQRSVAASIESGMITALTPLRDVESPEYAYAIPGFVDIHTHGGYGHDVMDGTLEAFGGLADYHVSRGTTTFVASTLTAPLDRLREVLGGIAAYRSSNKKEAGLGATAMLAGVHLEGPWISRANLGAQNEQHVISVDEPSLALVRENADLIKMVTFSYHDARAQALLALAVECDIIPALGHDETKDDQARQAFAAGVTHLTHAYSNSSSFQRKNGVKYLGSLEMALMTAGVTIELIVDDRHITRPFWDFVRHNKPIQEIIAVSDTTRAAGLPEDPDKIYDLGGVEMIVDQGVAWLPDRSSFAGSTSSLQRTFRLLTGEWGISLTDAVAVTSANAARKLGLFPMIGRVAPGSRADLLLLDDDLSVVRIVKSGITRGPEWEVRACPWRLSRRSQKR